MSGSCEITVVIPTYNRKGFITRALESVFNQTVQPAQIVVVDDGSTDGTAEVCKAYAPRVEYLWQQNAGPAAARNAGVRLARHPWLAFLDSDDYWTPSHLERMANAIRETAGEAAFYFSDMKMAEVDGGGTHWAAVGFRPNAPWYLIRDASAWVLMGYQPIFVQASMISKRAWESVGGMDTSKCIGEDSYLFCQLGIGGVACAVSGVGAVNPSDDRSDLRLTLKMPHCSEGRLSHECKRWRDVLRLEKLPPRFHRLVAYNVAESHLRLAKLMWHSRRPVQAVWHLMLVVRWDPRLFAWIIRNRTELGYEETVRPAFREQSGAGPAVSPINRPQREACGEAGLSHLNGSNAPSLK